MIERELEGYFMAGIAKEYVHLAHTILIYIAVLPILRVPELESPPLFDEALGMMPRGILLFEFVRHHLRLNELNALLRPLHEILRSNVAASEALIPGWILYHTALERLEIT